MKRRGHTATVYKNAMYSKKKKGHITAEKKKKKKEKKKKVCVYLLFRFHYLFRLMSWAEKRLMDKRTTCGNMILVMQFDVVFFLFSLLRFLTAAHRVANCRNWRMELCADQR
jgi:hypothetical protein